ncbi:uncharacterized protein K444DRAFT_610629 [Hyaloscypha bicolor E]|uniref:Uncharacterized protein n=1 Tax=Hyaloscypha bicolor E TaxID=1095630 RepID=A0A2J6THU9_9HELO|nr:uncharacterized protein K444DRAFT_610629 [Hyaloscypha bicolor E]PMD62583.1 hypothetical protein K444DRAFT_610629 [Hyaloscypha bicolor E]
MPNVPLTQLTPPSYTQHSRGFNIQEKSVNYGHNMSAMSSTQQANPAHHPPQTSPDKSYWICCRSIQGQTQAGQATESRCHTYNPSIATSCTRCHHAKCFACFERESSDSMAMPWKHP